MNTILRYSHCDPRVLHGPKANCEFCNQHADWQELREVWGINFTGEHDSSKQTCPAERARPLDSINAWGGNRPETPELREVRDQAFKEFAQVELDKTYSRMGVSSLREQMAEATDRPEQKKTLPKLRTTLSGRPPEPGYESASAPAPVGPNGQHLDYWVISDEERSKEWVRPYRDSYRHVGVRPKYPLRDLTPEEKERYSDCGYAKYETYPKSATSSVVGCFWTQDRLNSRCGSITDMGRKLSESWARNPEFYGSTFCANCGKHFPVEEFVWTADGKVLGS